MVQHVVIGTAGHVDHGKTTLVYALTGVLTDRLPEEQRRGITIELGFAPWRIDPELLVSIIDAPGHRRLVHTMIAGASGIDVVLLVVAADEGVMPQTREHIAACRLLGVSRAVVAVTKIDRVDAELAELAGAEARELLEKNGIAAEVVPCSAKSGAGLDQVRAAVLAAIRALPDKPKSRRARLSVDRVFTIKGSGTVVTGTLVSGELMVGESVRILGPGRELAASVRGLHVHGEACERAAAPTRLAVNLAGVAVDDVSRGDVISNDPHVRPTRLIDAWLEAAELPKRGAEATVFVGTARSTVKIQPMDSAADLGAGTLARLRLAAPLVVFGGDRYVLRGARVDGPAGAVFGGGVALDVHAPPRIRAAKRVELLTHLRKREAGPAMVALCRERAPHPIAQGELHSRFVLDGTELAKAADAAAQKGALYQVGKVGWTTAAALERLREDACARVAQHHQAAPLEPGMALQTLREQLARLAGTEVTAVALGQLTTGSKPLLIIDGTTVRLASFRGAAADSAAARTVARAEAVVHEAALQGVSEGALAEQTGADLKQTRTILAAMAKSGKALRAGELWFDGAAVSGLRTRIVDHLTKAGQLTIQDFKTMTGLGRKQTIPLLEHLDRAGVTKRQGDLRLPGPAAKKS